jgi:hypothetical protein
VLQRRAHLADAWKRWEVSVGLLYLRAIGRPFLGLCSIIALSFLQGRVTSPRRRFLFWLWGTAVLLLAFSAASAALLWADETPAQMGNNAQFNLLVGACAILLFALGLALGWRIRLEGERFLIAVVRPPASASSRSLRSWAIVPLALLWLALGIGAFAATYGVLSYLALAGYKPA